MRPSTYKVVEADAKGDDGFSSVEIILDLMLNARLGSIQHACHPRTRLVLSHKTSR